MKFLRLSMEHIFFSSLYLQAKNAIESLEKSRERLWRNWKAAPHTTHWQHGEQNDEVKAESSLFTLLHNISAHCEQGSDVKSATSW